MKIGSGNLRKDTGGGGKEGENFNTQNDNLWRLNNPWPAGGEWLGG